MMQINIIKWYPFIFSLYATSPLILIIVGATMDIGNLLLAGLCLFIPLALYVVVAGGKG